MKTVSKISAKSVAKIMALLYAIFGFIFGILAAIMSLFVSSQEAEGGQALALFFGILAPLVLPVIYGVFGWFSGYVGAWIYNFAARKVGGVQFDIS